MAKEPPPRELIERLVDERGIENVINPRGVTFKEMGLDLAKLTKKKAIDLMMENPNLLRRPLVLARGKTILGWNPSEYDALAK